MRKEILITSEENVKSLTAISDNVESRYLLPSIREAQEIYLCEIIGLALLDKLKWCVDNNAFRGSFSGTDYNDDYETTTGGNPQYKRLLDLVQYYLAYKSVACLIPKVAYKVTNMGVVKTNDDKVTNATYDEIIHKQAEFVGQADFYCLLMQNYLIDNRSQFPELNELQYRRMKANLYSSYTCGIWTGGARGKIL